MMSLGFFLEVEWETDRMIEHCHLIVKGKMIPVYGSCREALANNENDRYVVEDLSRVHKSPESAGSIYYY